MHNALNDPKSNGRISHLRVPFCLAYAKTPDTYRDGKLAPQAEACLHLGYSRSKPGYVLEVLEGPRKGRIITSSQVKFRESIFPKRVPTAPQSDLPTLWADILYESDHADDPSDAEDDLELSDLDEDLSSIESTRVSSDSTESTREGSDSTESSSDHPDEDINLEPQSAINQLKRFSPRLAARSSGPVLGETLSDYDALDKARNGAIRVLATKVDPADAKWSPSRFEQIASIVDADAKKEWYKAHYTENDGLFDYPDVLKMVPIPPELKDGDLLRLHTIYTVKSDGRKKARTVLGAGILPSPLSSLVDC